MEWNFFSIMAEYFKFSFALFVFFWRSSYFCALSASNFGTSIHHNVICVSPFWNFNQYHSIPSILFQTAPSLGNSIPKMCLPIENGRSLIGCHRKHGTLKRSVNKGVGCLILVCNERRKEKHPLHSYKRK